MPYYNRYAELCRGLTSLEYHYYAHDLEVIVCDDGSDEPLQLHSILDMHVVHLPGPKPPKNPCVPMNAAVAHSSGDILCLTNPEVVHQQPVIDALRQHLNHVDDYVIAACRNEWNGRWRVRSGVKYEHPVPSGAGFHFFAMLHRKLWDKAGGFDPAYRDGQGYEDNDWLWRLWHVGARFHIVDDAVVLHPRTRTRWPTGGRARNREILKRTWGPVWNQLS